MVVNYGGSSGGSGVTQDQLVNALTGDFRFDNKHTLVITTEIITDATPVPTTAPGVYTIMDASNPTVADYLDANGMFLRNALGVTLQVVGTSTELVRYEYEGNELDLKGVGIHHLGTNGWEALSRGLDLTQLEENFQFDNKHSLPITGEIITYATVPSTPGVFTVMDKTNALAISFVDQNGDFNNFSSGVTIQYMGPMAPVKLVRYEYPGNDIDVKGVGIHHLGSNGWDLIVNSKMNVTDSSGNVQVEDIQSYVDTKTTKTWIAYASEGIAGASSTASIGSVDGTKYEYTYNGDTIYRFVPDTYTYSGDAFYSDSALTQKIVSRA